VVYVSIDYLFFFLSKAGVKVTKAQGAIKAITFYFFLKQEIKLCGPLEKKEIIHK